MRIIGQNIVVGRNTNVRDYAIGLTYPLKMTYDTFNKSYTNLEALKSNIMFLLKTQIGERVMTPTFGTDLRKVLFLPNDEGIEQRIYDSINQAVKIWVPQVTIQSIEVSNTNEQRDNNTVSVKINFAADFTNETFSVKLDNITNPIQNQ